MAVRAVASTEATASAAVPWRRPRWWPDIPDGRPHGHVHGSGVLLGRPVTSSAAAAPFAATSLTVVLRGHICDKIPHGCPAQPHPQSR